MMKTDEDYKREREEYDQETRRLEAALKPRLTDDFLELLVVAVRTCGWHVDATETSDFVKWCFELADKPKPLDLNPYPRHKEEREIKK